MPHICESVAQRKAEAKQLGGRVIVFCSGKGGVGKTNLALNMGILLARRGQRVILMDPDFGLANTGILPGVSPLADVDDLLEDGQPVDRLLVEGPDGLRVLCGASGLMRRGRVGEVTPRECARAVARLGGCCETLLIDCGAGVSRTIISFALASDLLLLTTTPEPTALADAYAALKLLSNQGFAGRAGVVVNMVRNLAEARHVAGRLARVAQQFLGLSVEHVGEVPLDRHVPQAVRQRAPLAVRYPRCAASLCISRICDRIAPASLGRVPAGGVWSRMASLFL